MKRMHVHVAVADLEQGIGFYSALFAAQPAVIKADYAKWMLNDPRVNFAISTRGKQPSLDHLGIQVESKDELSDVYARLRRAGGTGESTDYGVSVEKEARVAHANACCTPQAALAEQEGSACCAT
jgi:hypothetical protein